MIFWTRVFREICRSASEFIGFNTHLRRGHLLSEFPLPIKIYGSLAATPFLSVLQGRSKRLGGGKPRGNAAFGRVTTATTVSHKRPPSRPRVFKLIRRHARDGALTRAVGLI